MLNSDLKNIVVLKNLPSNLVDEAIIILKSNKTAKRLEYIEKTERKTNVIDNEKKNNREYVIKEAESVIASYIEKLEKNKNGIKSNNNIENKYKKIKLYSIFVSIILFFSLIKILI